MDGPCFSASSRETCYRCLRIHWDDEIRVCMPCADNDKLSISIALILISDKKHSAKV